MSFGVGDHREVDITNTRAEVLVLGDEALVAVHGELDLCTIDVLTQALADIAKVSRVVIDLQEVTFVDYAALRRIDGLARDFAASGCTLRLDHPSGLVRRLIEIMRLDDLRVR